MSRSTPTEPLSRAQDRLLDAINLVQTSQSTEEARYRFYDANMIPAHPIVPNTRFAQFTGQDQLFTDNYEHPSDRPAKGSCEIGWLLSSSKDGDEMSVVENSGTTSTFQAVHHELTRDNSQEKESDLKATTVTNKFACLVIHRIYDYADTHDIGRWKAQRLTRKSFFAMFLLWRLTLHMI